jgi:cell division septation protein DedD
MPEKKEGSGGAARGTARRRQRFAARPEGGRVSRPLLVAMIIILAGAAYLFWPRGGGAPAGIGEQLTVVTADTTLADAPRSGNVEIQEQVQDIVPEKPAAGGSEPARQPEVIQESAAEERSSQQSAPPTKPAPAKPARQGSSPPPSGESAPTIAPRPSGSWAVQIGAFQAEENAQALVADMATKGVDAQVRAAGTSSGSIVYRVWIGWFKDRDEALAYAKQERRNIGDSYPVHR